MCEVTKENLKCCVTILGSIFSQLSCAPAWSRWMSLLLFDFIETKTIFLTTVFLQLRLLLFCFTTVLPSIH